MNNKKTEIKLLHPVGFKPEPIKSSDLVFGSAWNIKVKGFKGTVVNEKSDWEPYLFDKIYSNQAPGYETSGCVTHAKFNCIELNANRIHAHRYDWSDRMVTVGSGTSPAGGNVPSKVDDFLRHYWTVFEEEWPTSAARTQEEFYTPLPQELYEKAKKHKIYKYGHEQITNPTPERLREALKYGTVAISCVLTRGEDGIAYKPSGFRDTHYIALLRVDDETFRLLDSYPNTRDGGYVYDAKHFLPEMAQLHYIDYEQYDLLSQLVEKLKTLLQRLFPPAPPVIDKPMSNFDETLYEKSYLSVGIDASPADLAPDNLGCVESLSNLIQKADPELKFPTLLSTKGLHQYLLKSPSFKQVDAAKKGCIILSVTGTGNGKVKNGHAGVVGKNVSQDGTHWVMSNNSNTGRWDVVYTVRSWHMYYGLKGGMKTMFFVHK